MISRLEQLPSDQELAINAIIYGELRLMIEKSKKKQDSLALQDEFIKLVKIYEVDQETSTIYGKLHAEIFDEFAPKEEPKRRKFKIKDAGIHDHDLWIACTAIQYDMTVVSADSDFTQISRVRPLKLESWRSL